MSKPQAVITKLEDCPVWLDRELVKAYREAEYWLELPDGNRLLFQLGRPLAGLEAALESFSINNFGIITAYNPRSEQLPEQENRARNEALKTLLQGEGRFLLNSTAQSPDGAWLEPGFCILDIAPENLLELGRRFDQNAVAFWEKGSGAALWWLSGE